MKVLVRFRRCWHVILNGDEGIQGHSTATEKLADQEVRRLMWDTAKGYAKVGSRFEYLFSKPEVMESLRSAINYGDYDELQAHWQGLAGGKLPQIYYEESRVILARIKLYRFRVTDGGEKIVFSSDKKSDCTRWMRAHTAKKWYWLVDTKKGP